MINNSIRAVYLEGMTWQHWATLDSCYRSAVLTGTRLY